MIEPIDVDLSIDRRQAYALAELCKRIGWADCLRLSVSEEECRLMIAATDRLRGALEDAGVFVR